MGWLDPVLYTYCKNDPIQYVDPTGHMYFDIFGWTESKEPYYDQMEKEIQPQPSGDDVSAYQAYKGGILSAVEALDYIESHGVTAPDDLIKAAYLENGVLGKANSAKGIKLKETGNRSFTEHKGNQVQDIYTIEVTDVYTVKEKDKADKIYVVARDLFEVLRELTGLEDAKYSVTYDEQGNVAKFYIKDAKTGVIYRIEANGEDVPKGLFGFGHKNNSEVEIIKVYNNATNDRMDDITFLYRDKKWWVEPSVLKKFGYADAYVSENQKKVTLSTPWRELEIVTPEVNTPEVGYQNYILSEEEKMFIAVIYAEMGAERIVDENGKVTNQPNTIAWKAIAFIIMNRLDRKMDGWANANSVSDIITTKGAFSGYQDSNYKIVNYLNNRDLTNTKVELMIEEVLPIYLREDKKFYPGCCFIL